MEKARIITGLALHQFNVLRTASEDKIHQCRMKG
jgi:hypothetical protein